MCIINQGKRRAASAISEERAIRGIGPVRTFGRTPRTPPAPGRQRATKAATRAPPLGRSTAAKNLSLPRTAQLRVASPHGGLHSAERARWSLREHTEVTKPIIQMKRGSRIMQNERGDTYFQFQPALRPQYFAVSTSLLPLRLLAK